MNLGFYMCGILAVPFFIIGLLFAICKGKAAKFVSGFNSLPKKSRNYIIKPLFLVMLGTNALHGPLLC